MPESAAFVAFLRGINVGGNKIVKMEDLRKAFESMGFGNVKTLLASGNVIFEAPQAPASAIAKRIEEKLEKTFGFSIGVIVRTKEDLRRLSDAQPFKGIKVTPETRLYVTFLSEKPKSGLKIPYKSPDGNFTILRATDTEVCSVLTISPDSRTVDLMGILEKEFGKKVTTRNWNTVTKLTAS